MYGIDIRNASMHPTAIVGAILVIAHDVVHWIMLAIVVAPARGAPTAALIGAFSVKILGHRL
jgi:hypothetical protein